MSAQTVTVNKFIWDFTGQAAHFAVAALAMVVVGKYIPHGHLYGFLIGVPAAALKEFWYDFKYEDAATRGSSLLDFSMYMAGLVLGFFI